jgi:hypothetical protein
MEFLFVLIRVLAISFIKIFAHYHISVLSDSLKASLLAYSTKLSGADLFWSIHVVLQVNLFSKVHLCSASLMIGEGSEREIEREF